MKIGGRRRARSLLTRPELAEKRLRSILRSYVVASDRTLEQKISDAGPTDQRIDPHILTPARQKLVKEGEIVGVRRGGLPWYHLATADPTRVAQRLVELETLHRQTQQGVFVNLIGQALEIAVFRALQAQTVFEYFGAFPDLDAHDDTTLYSKIEPPSIISGRSIQPHNLDFLIHAPTTGFAAIEVKNVRQWMHPNRPEIRSLLFKCCTLDVVPVLISRRIQYSSFSVLNPCGIIIHQTYNQLYPSSHVALAEQVKRKDTLGYFDVRIGNEPDARLIRFIHEHLLAILPAARQKFDVFKDLLLSYAIGDLPYKSFAARAKRRMRNEPEDWPMLQRDDADEPEGMDDWENSEDWPIDQLEEPDDPGDIDDSD